MTDDRLNHLPQYGWRNQKAWDRLRRAKPWLLKGQDGRLYFVDSGGWASHLEGNDAGRSAGHASRLLDPAKKDPRRR